MRTRSTVTIAAACAMAAALLTSCKDKDPTPTNSSSGTTPVTSTSTSQTPTPTPTPTTAEDRAKAAINSLITNYYKVVDDVALDPKLPLDTLYQVTTGKAAQVRLMAAQQFRGKQYTQTGRVKLVVAKINSIDLAKGKEPTATVTTCIDVEEVTAVDKAGKSVVAADRGRFYIETMTITNAQKPAADEWWRVAVDLNRKAASCDGI